MLCDLTTDATRLDAQHFATRERNPTDDQDGYGRYDRVDEPDQGEDCQGAQERDGGYVEDLGLGRGGAGRSRRKPKLVIRYKLTDVWISIRDDLQMDEVADALGSLILPDENRTVLKCGTKNLDLISQQNIGDGAKLPN